ncbi:MAG: DNA repair protein RecO C-terminal domain-containing protein [Bacteroidales bacterium]|jgi:DNA repair protein RecO (recombination protein O)|nr:DNA repair protein RecO C-terminal domain-containing protein [Bacteroidales bacterium]
MKSKAELIILNHTKFGENSIVLHTLSSEYGRRGFLVKVSPRTAMALFLPLNILEAEVTENPKSSLWFARNFVSVNPLNGIRSNIHKNTMTLFMSEVLYRVVKDQTNEDGLADWLKGQILTLDALQSDFANFHLLFLLNLCAALGFDPDLAGLAPFADKKLIHIEALLKTPFAEALLLPLSGADRNAIAESILKYIEYHTESAVNVRSLAVLREIYG